MNRGCVCVWECVCVLYAFLFTGLMARREEHGPSQSWRMPPRRPFETPGSSGDIIRLKSFNDTSLIATRAHCEAAVCTCVYLCMYISDAVSVEVLDESLKGISEWISDYKDVLLTREFNRARVCVWMVIIWKLMRSWMMLHTHTHHTNMGCVCVNCSTNYGGVSGIKAV